MLALWVYDIGGGKTHLVTDHGAAQFHGGKDQSGDKAYQETEQGLLGNYDAEAQWGEWRDGYVLGEHREKCQGEDNGEAGPEFYRDLLAAEDRDAADKCPDPGRTDQKGLELFDRDKLQFQYMSSFTPCCSMWLAVSIRCGCGQLSLILDRTLMPQ